ncbi:MAG: DUF1697 domain-containing protein [Gemmatimonadaceae bacterium]
MPRYIAFLRAVNVGGRVVKMAHIKSIFESIGLSAVETFIASGNVIFSTRSTVIPSLVTTAETALKKALGYEVPVFIRTDAEVVNMAERKYTVFSATEVDGAHSLNIGCLHAPFPAEAQEAMSGFDTECESFRTDGSEIFMLLHRSVVNSRFSITKFEKAIGAGTTFRNINTIQRLAAKYPPICA